MRSRSEGFRGTTAGREREIRSASVSSVTVCAAFGFGRMRACCDLMCSRELTIYSYSTMNCVTPASNRVFKNIFSTKERRGSGTGRPVSPRVIPFESAPAGTFGSCGRWRGRKGGRRRRIARGRRGERRRGRRKQRRRLHVPARRCCSWRCP